MRPRYTPARQAICFVMLGWICCSAGLAGSDQQRRPSDSPGLTQQAAPAYNQPTKQYTQQAKKPNSSEKPKSSERDDVYDYAENPDYHSAIIIDDSNDLENNYVPIVPHLAPAVPRPVYHNKKPDYAYKFKYYPAVGYDKGAKIIFLDDHDYYHPYYTPSGYESLKTVKKSVSKIQKELKKATKFQPHYDHLYGKGRVKQYLITKPPQHYGPPGGGYGKSYHQPHPVTGHDIGGIEDYLNYDVEFDRAHTLQH